MNPIVIQLANGNAFFIGIGMTVIAFALYLWLSSRISVILLTITWLVGISLFLLSAAPMSLWLYGLWFGLCIAARIAFNIHTSFKFKISIVVAFAIFSLLVCLAELPFHFAKTISVSKNQTIFVLGDSISAGIGKERAWPDVLSDLSRLKVVNLARPGATIETAFGQIDDISSTNSFIILEIGGNDLLGHTDSRTFYTQLDRLLGKLKRENNQVVMFELPLLPFWNSFGKAQRILAKKYGVILIPKSYLTKVFASKGDTVDGLHLSQKGHDALANSVYGLLKISP
ncbi:MAG: GDSL-type esterase/lipase family protein [Verrucomicrobiota bacterium]|jgi:acyl-CoA thioesterase-1